jgi:hypothetical protein
VKEKQQQQNHARMIIGRMLFFILEAYLLFSITSVEKDAWLLCLKVRKSGVKT